MQKSATTFSSYILLQQHILNVIRLTGQGYNCTFLSSPVIYNWIVSRLLVLPLSLLTVTLLNCWKISDWLVIFLRSIQRSWIRLKHETTASDLELMMVLAGWLDGAHDHNDKNDKRPETSKPWSGFVHYIPSQCHKWIISFSSRSTMMTMMIWLGSWSVYGRDKKSTGWTISSTCLVVSPALLTNNGSIETFPVNATLPPFTFLLVLDVDVDLKSKCNWEVLQPIIFIVPKL